LPVQARVTRTPFNCGQRSNIIARISGAETSGVTCVKRARPPKITQDPSGDIR
jgi:hypothetical protein